MHPRGGCSGAEGAVPSRAEARARQADMWAFACVVGEMLSGEQPWAGLRATEILMMVVMNKQAPPIPEGLPHQVCRRHNPYLPL